MENREQGVASGLPGALFRPRGRRGQAGKEPGNTHGLTAGLFIH